MPSGPRKLDFDLSEAFLRMDEAVAETIAGLPDFPGFQTRTTLKLECAEEGYESYEMNYTLPEDTIGDELVTQEYVEVLKEYWPSINYEVHDEREYPDGTPKALEARRADGINVWYSNMLGQIVIHSQAICVRAEGHAVCGPPLGGVAPENDNTKGCTVEPADWASEATDAASTTESATSEMMAPFQGQGITPIPFRSSGTGSNGSGSTTGG